jgi:hypothetical protein
VYPSQLADYAGDLAHWQQVAHDVHHPLHSLQEQVDLCAAALPNLTPTAEVFAVVFENIVAALAQSRTGAAYDVFAVQ